METKNLLELKVFKAGYVDKLYRDVATTNSFDSYGASRFPFEEQYPKGGTEIFLDAGFKLDPSKSDLDNSKSLYEALKGLNETQASDERLWTYLTHVTFWDYMKERWPVDDSLGRIKDRYFLRTLSIETLTRNGISRLWWYAHLTYDASRKNPYELTEVLLSRADLSVGITERALGSNINIRTALLEFLRDNPKISSNENSTRELMKGLNLVGGVRNLPFLEISEIRSVLEQMKTALAS